jgi:serine protease Do
MRIVRTFGVLVIVLAVAAVVVAVAPSVRGQAGARVEPPLVLQGMMLGDDVQIGASVRDIDEADVTRQKLGGETGAVIEEVSSDGPAAAAGLKAGDVVTEYDGEKVRSARHLIRLVRESRDNRPVKIVVMRDGKRTELTVTPRGWRGRTRSFTFDGPLRDSLQGLREFNLPRDFGRNFRFDFEGPRAGARGRLGITVQEITPQLADFFGVKDGVLVTSVAADSAASKAGLKAGDVITAVNGHTVLNSADLTSELRDVDDGKEISIEVTRDRKAMTLKATPDPGPRRRITRRAP